MPMRRSRFPDYFGSRPSRADGGGDHRVYGSLGNWENGDDIDAIDIDAIHGDAASIHSDAAYAVQPMAPPAAAARTPRCSAFRPNFWAHAGTQATPEPRPTARPTTGLDRFVLREPESACAARTQAAASAQTPRFAGAAVPLLPQTPWSLRQPVRSDWRRPPLRDEQAPATGPSLLVRGNAGATRPRPGPGTGPGTGPKDRRRPEPPVAPPTPRHSSPSPAAVRLHSPARRPLPPAAGPPAAPLVRPAALDPRFRPLFPYDHFNAVQSQCFPGVHGSDDNVVVAAPTGSGKTVLFELAICRLLAQQDTPPAAKIVYQAPTKALCSERARDWQHKFRTLGLHVAECTGDSSAADVRRVRAASIIVTTPEKWDSLTRKWADHRALLQTVQLFLIDEVHILRDARGATLETVVSRMKALGRPAVRFVALSATIPNAADLARWLGLRSSAPHAPARTLVFGPDFRPVRLDKIVLGYHLAGGNEHTLDSVLDDQLPDLIVRHAQGKPVLVFCFTRKSAESAAAVLADHWAACPLDRKPWPGPSRPVRTSTARLQNAVAAGVAFHHGGLDRRDRDAVEDAYLHRQLSIVCCTSTLAVGVNLPCHTVVLKGTTGYQGGRFAEYDEFDVLQMIGRAGRPQFDTTAKAIILTRQETRDKYRRIESSCQPVESTLHRNLTEHLNAEIVLATVSSPATAVRWLQGTFLAVRLPQNPAHYQLADAHGGPAATPTPASDLLRAICQDSLARLVRAGLVRYTDEARSQFCSTPYGGAMSTYMVRCETMELILGLPKVLAMEELFHALCRASEFDVFRIKSTERASLRELNQNSDVPFRFADNSIAETWQKISLLVQVELLRGAVPFHQRVSLEARQAVECLQRLLECYTVCAVADQNGSGTKAALDLSRSLRARAWEGHHAQLCQVPDIGPVHMKKLVDRQVTTVRALADAGPVALERLLAKNPPAAMKMADCLRSFPRLVLDGCVARAGVGAGAGAGAGARKAKAGTTGEAGLVGTVRLGFANEGGLPRWRNRVPDVTFLAQTADGVLLHIWRGKLPAKQHQVAFPVPAAAAEAVVCSFTCDEVVGTMQTLQLPCMDHTPQKRKRPSYPTQWIAAGETVAECIDLSTAEDDDGERERKRSQRLADGGRDLDSFAFANAPRPATTGRRDGTAQDPIVLDDSASDDFGTDIFDDVEFPGLPDSADTAGPLCSPGESPLPLTERSSPNTAPTCRTDVSAEHEAGGKKTGGTETGGTDTGGTDVPRSPKAARGRSETAEPGWASTSNRVVDFLRGHVQFV